MQVLVVVYVNPLTPLIFAITRHSQTDSRRLSSLSVSVSNSRPVDIDDRRDVNLIREAHLSFSARPFPLASADQIRLLLFFFSFLPSSFVVFDSLICNEEKATNNIENSHQFLTETMGIKERQ